MFHNGFEQVVMAVLLAGLGRHIEELATPEMTDGACRRAGTR